MIRYTRQKVFLLYGCRKPPRWTEIPFETLLGVYDSHETAETEAEQLKGYDYTSIREEWVRGMKEDIS